ncbi:hypothetical protein [Cryptosporangium sp. NPDC048952]|uniref:hypothetical protein n=1 Tax=Cryptosporangium sp. NPDC048952 TaxID=3363961 RepID=UPI00371F79A5
MEPAVVITGDPDRLRQLTERLLGLLRGPSGPDPARDSIRLRRTGGAAELVVTSSRHLAHIAGTGDGFSSANTTGTGDADTRVSIGLILARIITERHGGTLTVTDQPDGSTLTVRLPATTR